LVRVLVVVALAWLLTVAISPSPVPAVIGANRTSAASAEAQVASWSRTYGGTSDDEACAIVPTSDGGYVVAGITQSFGAGGDDVWVLKLDGLGNVQWQKTYGGPGADAAFDMARTSDGGYAVTGRTLSFEAGQSDVWVLKLEADGTMRGCPSGLVRDSTASVSSTSVSPSNSSAVVQATSASPVALSAVIRTSSASVAEVCSGIGFRLYLPLVLRMR
jgi:hypothetical protein